MKTDKPQWWFRAIHEANDELKTEPQRIEYLRMWTGETFIHTGGTALWTQNSEGPGCLDIAACMAGGITHYRIPRG